MAAALKVVACALRILSASDRGFLSRAKPALTVRGRAAQRLTEPRPQAEIVCMEGRLNRSVSQRSRGSGRMEMRLGLRGRSSKKLGPGRRNDVGDLD
jgi:hypothetical protein